MKDLNLIIFLVNLFLYQCFSIYVIINWFIACIRNFWKCKYAFYFRNKLHVLFIILLLFYFFILFLYSFFIDFNSWVLSFFIEYYPILFILCLQFLAYQLILLFIFILNRFNYLRILFFSALFFL